MGSAILVAGLIVLLLLGGCAETPKYPVVTESTKPYLTEQPADRSGQDARVISVRPSPKQAEEIRTPNNKARLSATEEPQTPMASPEQQVVRKDKTESTPDTLIRTLSIEDVTRLIPGHVQNRADWAGDILKVFAALNLPSSPTNVCSVLAVIQQESGFQANPAVNGMHQLILGELENRYGEYGKQALQKMLDIKPAGEKATFWDRLMAAKTEYDVDSVFRDYVVYQEVGHPKLISVAAFTGKAFGIDDLDQLNPISTIGSMQVSVKFSQEQAKFYGMGAWQTREFLYTRYGGIYYGALRLLGYQSNYTDPIYRFADYNLGVYASRNAAVQQQLSALIGYKLALDGDLLRYTQNGAVASGEGESEKAILAFAKRYAPALGKKTIHNDLYSEKSAALENTKTYLAIKQAYADTYGTPSYARLPEVEIHSPKIRSRFTTAGFAKAVDGKYQRCINTEKAMGGV